MTIVSQGIARRVCLAIRPEGIGGTGVRALRGVTKVRALRGVIGAKGVTGGIWQLIC